MNTLSYSLARYAVKQLAEAWTELAEMQVMCQRQQRHDKFRVTRQMAEAKAKLRHRLLDLATTEQVTIREESTMLVPHSKVGESLTKIDV